MGRLLVVAHIVHVSYYGSLLSNAVTVMVARSLKYSPIGIAGLLFFFCIAPANAVLPWPTVVRMVGDFALSVAGKFVANEASHYLHKDEYESLQKRLSTLEAEVGAYRGSDVPSSEYRDVIERLQIARTRLDEMGQRLERVEGRVNRLEQRVDKMESAPGARSSGTPVHASTGYFDFTICNRTASNISVAVEYLSPELGGRVVQGWKTVQGGQCAPGGRFMKGEFRFFAKENSGPRQWSGNQPVCVEFSSFKRLRNSPQNCPNHQLKYFNTKFVDSDNWTATINPGG
jgi:uncharacterized membrane protein